MKVWIKSFGCKVSQYEAQLFRENLAAAGDEIVSSPEEADKVVIQTCAVTERAAKEGLRLARKAAKNHQEVTITGCLARMTGASAVTANPGTGPAYRRPQAGHGNPEEITRISPEDFLSRFPASRKNISYFAGHSRAFLKIEDGCPQKCAYCLVSRIRGPIKSKPASDVLSELDSLAANGYREVVFCGINLGCYGRDCRTNLLALLKTIFARAGLPAGFRIRLSSLEPNTVSPELLDLISAESRIYPHLHLPLQSGSDQILEKMGRPYNLSEYRELVDFARRKIPGLILSTDLMVGFPGETERDFNATLETAREIKFDRVHVFRFSSRPGTPAASFPDPVPERVKSDRAASLRSTVHHGGPRLKNEVDAPVRQHCGAA